MRNRAAFVAAWRSLAAAPASTFAVVLALVFAVGAWHAVGAVWNSVVGRGLPYRDSDQLVALSSDADTPFRRFLSDREAALLRERAESFAWVGHLWGASMVLGDPPSRFVQAGALEPGFLETLGVSVALGRPFLPEDHEGTAPGEPASPATLDRGQAVVLLSHDLWRSAFASSPEVVGAEIVLNREPMRVIGVMPSGFFTPALRSELWAPARRQQIGTGPGGRSRSSNAYARLQPGVSPATAAAEASALLSAAGFREEGALGRGRPVAGGAPPGQRPPGAAPLQ